MQGDWWGGIIKDDPCIQDTHAVYCQRFDCRVLKKVTDRNVDGKCQSHAEVRVYGG